MGATDPSQPFLLIPGPPSSGATSLRRRRPPPMAVLVSCLLLASLAAVIINGGFKATSPAPENARLVTPEESTAKDRGVSEKRFLVWSSDCNGSFDWTTEMLAWQRTAYHFQPKKNWMNDPDGPLYHMGWYHLFYQYNPDAAVWGNITWGHAVARDLIHWLYLPLAFVPDQWYDINGVWTGSATILPGGYIAMLYTGDTYDSAQVQNLAYPANLSDPLLLDWVKYTDNPVLTPPEGIGAKDFRDPSTAWAGPDGLWRVVIGSKVNTTGVALVYKTTTNFTSYELEDHVLHAVPGTGMWECVDFYPVATTGQEGLDTSCNGPGVKHVLKASIDDDKHDWYAIGAYDAENGTWTPDDPKMDVGIGLRVDYGKYYASKTFYDPENERRILWGWAGETDSEDTDLRKGWASIQTIPRVVTFDNKTGSNIVQWPVDEVESLRSTMYEFRDVLMEPRSVVNLDIGNATQLDISVEFVIDRDALNTTADATSNCSTASTRGAFGPFGLLVLTDESFTELTPVYFHISKANDNNITNWFCTDKSTLAPDVDVQVYGGPVPILKDENYSMRVLVDHSVVEAFGQGGRTCITSRIYPTQAIYGNAKLFLFNNATDLNVTASLMVWQMDSAHIRPFPFDAKI